jgi:hypothetical protein
LLALCREAAAGETCPAIAVERWIALRRACEMGCSNRERRFRQRAYERARDRALLALLLHAQAANKGDRDDHPRLSTVRRVRSQRERPRRPTLKNGKVIREEQYAEPAEAGGLSSAR